MIGNIRNFVIIAHIDHGKSTLADRFLELTGTVDLRHMKPQFLDRLESERERGITIKMAPVRMVYRPAQIQNPKSLEIVNSEFILNLIDTPGHSDFSYEVSRALAAVEGAILLVDVSQGIQAQTFVNLRLAQKAGLKIIGAVNKIDLFRDHKEMIEGAIKELADLLKVKESEIFKISSKTGEGVKELLDAIIVKFPTPRGSAFSSIGTGVPSAPAADGRLHSRSAESDFSRTPSSAELRELPYDKKAEPKMALVFDSIYDDHKGVIAFIRVMAGEYEAGEETNLIAADHKFKIKEVGYFLPELKSAGKLSVGEIGYIATGIKDPEVLRIGDTIGNQTLHGYEPPRPVIFVSLYPDNADEYEDLRQGLQKLKLNDSALSFEPDFNEVLGRGFKTGFLGQLHFEITAERLEKELGLKTISTFPSVAYRVKLKNQYFVIKNIEDLKDEPEEIWEPMIKVEIVSPQKYFGNIMNLKEVFRMKDIKFDNLENKMLLTTEMPLADLITDFDGQLKSVSEGMASFSYELVGEEKVEALKMEILVAGEVVPGLTRLIYKDNVAKESRQMLEKLKDLLPRQLFVQSLQARARGQIIARENIPALKKELGNFGKNGGDRTRKMKLWKKQQRGKARLKMAGRVTIPPEIFKELLKK